MPVHGNRLQRFSAGDQLVRRQPAAAAAAEHVQQQQLPQQSNLQVDDEHKNTSSTDAKDETKQDSVNDKEEHQQKHSHSHAHHNHDHRHKRRFPNSAIHSELTLHRDGSSLYKNSLMHHKTAHREENQDRGA